MAFLKKLFSKDEKIPKDFWSTHDKNDTPMTWVFWKGVILIKVRLYLMVVAMVLYFLISFVMYFISGDNFEMIDVVSFILCILLFLILIRKEKIFFYLYKREYKLNHYYDNV